MKVCNTLQLQVEDLRAIQEADIDLKSMTVLTGPSGSGKSELLKFTYRLLDSISRYEQIIRTEPYQQMDSIEKDLYQIVQSLPSAHLKKPSGSHAPAGQNLTNNIGLNNWKYFIRLIRPNMN